MFNNLQEKYLQFISRNCFIHAIRYIIQLFSQLLLRNWLDAVPCWISYDFVQKSSCPVEMNCSPLVMAVMTMHLFEANWAMLLVAVHRNVILSDRSILGVDRLKGWESITFRNYLFSLCWYLCFDLFIFANFVSMFGEKKDSHVKRNENWFLNGASSNFSY